MPVPKKAVKKVSPIAPEAPPETREDKLKRLAAKRVKVACDKIRLIGNLSAYKPTDEQIDKIMEALGTSCAAIDARMRGVKRSAADFTL